MTPICAEPEPRGTVGGGSEVPDFVRSTRGWGVLFLTPNTFPERGTPFPRTSKEPGVGTTEQRVQGTHSLQE